MSIIYFGVRGFEPPTLASRTRCATTALHPEFFRIQNFYIYSKHNFFLLYIVSIEKKLVNKIFQFYKNSQIKEKFMEKERGFKRGSEKMTVVDTLQAAYSKQDIPQEEREYAKKFFERKINLSKITKDEIERFFSVLREITDKVALMNSPYPSELELAFLRLEEFWNGLSTIDLGLIPGDVRLLFISHLTFHRETVADIITEARELLMEDRRTFLKRLVQYHREFTKWLQQIEKKYL